MKNIIKTFSISALLLGGFAHAQHAETLSSIEKTEARSLWFFGSNNAAGLTIDQNDFANRVLTGFNRTSGDFRRLQAGETESVFNLKADGGLQLGEGFAWGVFDYNHVTHRGTRWNTSLLNPFRDMPFFIADPNVSDWVIQTYFMQAKLSTPFLFGDRIALGLDITYRNEIGAKQVDPRATNRFYSVNVKPGLIYRVNLTNFIGISGEFLNHREDHVSSRAVHFGIYPVYVMRGLGFNQPGQISSGTGTTTGFPTSTRWSMKDLWGGEIQYGTRIGNVSALLSVGYRMGVEDLFEAPTEPKRLGTVRTDEFRVNLRSTFGSNNNLNLVNLGMSNTNMRGIEYVQELDQAVDVRRWIVLYQSTRSTFDRMNIGVSYDFFRGRSETDYAWRAGLFANYISNKDAYIIPVGIQDFTAVNLGIHAKYNWAINPQSQILFGARIMHHNSLNNEFAYHGPGADDRIITEFVIPDFEMRTMNHTLFGAEMTFHFRLQNTGFFAGQHLDYITAPDGLNRIFYSVRVGFTF